MKYLRKAQKYIPNNAECISYTACVLRRMGDLDKAEKHFMEALKLDPNNREINFDAALNYYLLRDYTTALKYFNKTLDINPELAEAHIRKIDVYLNKEGNTDNAKQALEEASLSINISHFPELIEKVLLINLSEGNYQKAINYLNTTSFEAAQGQFYYYPKNLFYAWVYDLMNNSQKARHYYNLSRQQIEKKLQKYPDDSRYYSSSGICYAGLNQKENAIQFGKKGIEMLPIEIESWRGYHRLMELAQIYVMTGEYDLALEQLDFLLSVPGELSVKRLQVDFKWKLLWEMSEFKELIKKYS